MQRGKNQSYSDQVYKSVCPKCSGLHIVCPTTKTSQSARWRVFRNGGHKQPRSEQRDDSDNIEYRCLGGIQAKIRQSEMVVSSEVYKGNSSQQYVGDNGI